MILCQGQARSVAILALQRSTVGHSDLHITLKSEDLNRMADFDVCSGQSGNDSFPCNKHTHTRILKEISPPFPSFPFSSLFWRDFPVFISVALDSSFPFSIFCVSLSSSVPVFFSFSLLWLGCTKIILNSKKAYYPPIMRADVLFAGLFIAVANAKEYTLPPSFNANSISIAEKSKSQKRKQSKPTAYIFRARI